MATERKTTKKAPKKTAAKSKAPRKTQASKASVGVTIQHADVSKGPLPRGTVKAVGSKLNIKVERLARAGLKDQRARMIASDGCISNPGGPSC